jgi:hypothetical protein
VVIETERLKHTNVGYYADLPAEEGCLQGYRTVDNIVDEIRY